MDLDGSDFLNFTNEKEFIKEFKDISLSTVEGNKIAAFYQEIKKLSHLFINYSEN